MAVNDNYIWDVIRCIWHAIETDTDLKTKDDGGTGWRVEQNKPGGKNFKMDSESYTWRSDAMTDFGKMPAITILPGRVGGKYGGSSQNRLVFELRVLAKIKTRDIQKMTKFAVIIHDCLAKGIHTKFEDEANGYTNLIELIELPHIDFDDFTLDDDYIWDIIVPITVHIMRTVPR